MKQLRQTVAKQNKQIGLIYSNIIINYDNIVRLYLIDYITVSKILAKNRIDRIRIVGGAITENEFPHMFKWLNSLDSIKKSEAEKEINSYCNRDQTNEDANIGSKGGN